MDSGVHVWSTPLGYCDDAEAEGIIKDEEEISEEQQDGSYCPEPAGPVADPLGLAGDQPSVGDRPGSPGSAETELNCSSAGESQHAEAAVAPANVFLVPDEAADEGGDDWDPAAALRSKAEAEQLTNPTQYTVGVSAAPRTYCRTARGGGAAGHHPAPAPSADRPPPPPLLDVLIDPDSGRELFTCSVCRRSFKWKQQLERHHRQRHPQLKPYECDQCGRCFRRQMTLWEHRRLHSDERSSWCDTCGRNFVTMSRLRKHKKTLPSCSAPDIPILLHDAAVPREVVGATFRPEEGDGRGSPPRS